jgi:hypothetical protein
MYKLTSNKDYVQDLSFTDGNRTISIELEEYKQWLSEGNTPEPEFTEEEIAKQELDKQISEAKQYLASTDWYIIRYADSGKEVPSDIKIKREEARISIGGINE